MFNEEDYKPPYHVIISISFFLASLCCTAFYEGGLRGIWLLLFGWLGFIDCHFSWYANPLYLYAIFFRFSKKLISLRIELIALLLSLSFLLYSKILYWGDESGRELDIVRYGWGYYLWILSFATLFIGDLAAYKLEKQVFHSILAKGLTLLAVCAAVFIFSYQCFIGENSPFQIQRERARVFKDKCKLAGEKIYRKPIQVTGIYFPQNYGGVVYDQINNGAYGFNMHGIIGAPMVIKGFLQFYETDNEKRGDRSMGERPYLLFTKEDPLKGIEVDKLASQYTVIIRNMTSDIRKELDIDGAEVKIIENSSQEVLAKTTYFTSRDESKFCGCSQAGRFSTDDFVVRVLELSSSKKTGNN